MSGGRRGIGELRGKEERRRKRPLRTNRNRPKTVQTLRRDGM